MNTRKNNTRKGLLALAMVLMMSLTTSAQVFVLDEENNRTQAGNSNIGNLQLPEINSGNDHGFAPLGSGTVLLVALGGAYMLRKKERRQ